MPAPKIAWSYRSGGRKEGVARTRARDVDFIVWADWDAPRLRLNWPEEQGVPPGVGKVVQVINRADVVVVAQYEDELAAMAVAEQVVRKAWRAHTDKQRAALRERLRALSASLTP